jgi:hypothetical protein
MTRQIDGQNKVTFGGRRSQYWVITRRILGQTKLLFGTGEVDLGSKKEEL